MAAAAASRRTDDDLELLERACERVEAAISDSRVAAVHDVEFHRAIGSATHNELYVVLLDAVGVALLDVRRANLGTPTADSLTIAHHRAILDAIRAGSGACGGRGDATAPRGCGATMERGVGRAHRRRRLTAGDALEPVLEPDLRRR